MHKMGGGPDGIPTKIFCIAICKGTYKYQFLELEGQFLPLRTKPIIDGRPLSKKSRTSKEVGIAQPAIEFSCLQKESTWDTRRGGMKLMVCAGTYLGEK